ncbi:MAG: FecR domain-containing protein [Butyricimonas faecihominis]
MPRGGEYALVLADGTRVWLNAETELSYPSYFSGKDRRVKLKGEAYFEVTADTSMPFIVETKHLQINVLGTSFNISAYPDESHHATLAKGKIKAIYEEKQVILSPGEQALLTDSGMIVHAVDIATYTSWKERRFVFKNKPLQEVARDLERWYNVRLTIRQDAQPIRLTANLPKYENIEKILHIIENIARVKCETNDQEIIIKPE